jgi:LysR family hydrogen peroxide-inducible transcriptional activator
MITLRQLRYLTALAEHRHFGKAAEACAVTQPALSMQIRELEKDLGIDLVERRPGEVILTETGAEVTRRAERVLAAARDLTEFARHSGRLLTGRLRLGVIPTLAPYVLPKILPALQQRFPDLRVELRETQTRILTDELIRGALDAVLLALPLDESEIESTALFDDPFLLAVPAREARPEGRPNGSRVDARDIDQQRLILLEEGHCLRDQALAFCGAARGDAPAGLGATSLSTVMQMVANGYGVTLVPKIAVGELRDERVKVLRFRDPEPVRSIGLAWRRTSPRKADFNALGQIVRETLAA